MTKWKSLIHHYKWLRFFTYKAVFIFSDCIPIYNIICTFYIMLKDLLNYITINKVITCIHKINPITICNSNSFIHRIIYPTIRFTNPIINFICILFYNINCSVSTPTINNNILQIRIRLSNNRVNCSFNS